MDRRVWDWRSPTLQRTMQVACWGNFGKPVILFPTAAADCFDYERFLMIKKLAPLIEAGRVKVYSIEGITGDAWLDPDAHPGHKAYLQAKYDDYLVHELLPFLQRDCGGYKGFVAAGASLGAFNSINAAAKHPEWFDLVIAMSGTYDFDRWMDGHRDEHYYFNQPMYFLPNLGPSAQLDRLKKVRFVVASGTGRYEAPDKSRRIAEILRAKGVPTQLELWGPDAHHDWPTWRTMLPLFLDRLVP